MSEIKKVIWGTTKYIKGGADLELSRGTNRDTINLSLLSNELFFKDESGLDSQFSMISKKDFFDLVDLFIEARADLMKINIIE